MRNIAIQIFFFYVLSVAIITSALYYAMAIVGVTSILAISLFIISLSLISGLLVSKSAIEPLNNHLKNLESFSKETLHELNIPISTIKANLQMLSKNETNEKSLKRLKRIDEATTSLQDRYNELDYLIKKQMKKSHLENFDLSEVIENRVEVFKALYVNVKFSLTLEEVSVNMDKIAFIKVCDNILDNAIKYSSLNSNINIRLSNSVLEFEDSGCGMDEFELLNIFDEYYQNDETQKGFGIGLKMVKSFCDSSKVALHIKSKKDIGTTIILNFKEVTT
ncbi:MAG: sensor histidine kinase [Helicobacteraceae bacterium]|nr:sensor histidine kinase [Helicobacteraceae bacterium]